MRQFDSRLLSNLAADCLLGLLTLFKKATRKSPSGKGAQNVIQK